MILEIMFGESIDIESLEKAISGSSQKTLRLYGKDLYRDLLEQRKLEVEYGGVVDETPKKRILEPWALIVYKSSLYLLCNDQN